MFNRITSTQSMALKAFALLLILLFPYCMVNARLDRIISTSSKKNKKPYLLLQVQKSKHILFVQSVDALAAEKPIHPKSEAFAIIVFLTDFISITHFQKFFRFSDLPPPSKTA